jgi:hypothetical protein
MAAARTNMFDDPLVQVLPPFAPSILDTNHTSRRRENITFPQYRSIKAFHTWPSHKLFGNEGLEEFTIISAELAILATACMYSETH